MISQLPPNKLLIPKIILEIFHFAIATELIIKYIGYIEHTRSKTINQFEVVKTTKKYITIIITYKTGEQGRHTIRNNQSFNDAMAYIQDNKDIIALLKICSPLITTDYAQQVKRLYKPTAKQKADAKKQREERENWFKKNEKYLDAETEKMANHPGFLGMGVSIQEVNSTISKECQGIYGI
jgi:hypothetical protein